MPDSCPASLVLTLSRRGEPYPSYRRPVENRPAREPGRAITSPWNDYYDPRNRHHDDPGLVITIIPEQKYVLYAMGLISTLA